MPVASMVAVLRLTPVPSILPVHRAMPVASITLVQRCSGDSENGKKVVPKQVTSGELVPTLDTI